MPRPAPHLAAWVRRHRVEVALVLPLFGYVLVLTVAPIVDTLRISFTDPLVGHFPSLGNYRRIFASEVFRTAVLNTTFVALVSLVLQLVVGLGVALLLHAQFPLRGLVRTVMLVPLGVPTVVAGAVMLLIFARAGYLNALLFALADALNPVVRTAWGAEWRFVPLSWTVAGGWRTLLTVAIADMWKVLPMVTLIFLAGLEAIAPEVYEAAHVDGATRRQRFFRVTLPLLAPYATMAIILRGIDALRIFELALVLAGRVEPVLGTYVWSRYGPPTNDPYTAAATAVVLFGLIMVFVLLYLRLIAGRVEVRT